ncbi:tRNA (adenosine(37)-N6)-threonylcarbamoyltransferase complex ATPase subunit type 1 TsaE [Prolixibacter sp. NT017]|uniref:tRNA (adenosine(37)-N6)-threonylcarbamoyltransferase complex ATPase subunit type 1 TsaE n=1 Tax=Prolixibacter sp. NT017 TaxID=2652390 RepID=UPI0012840728|nr:tRNA (adenosine(37)-N6)-threonylcarbamoyltransferase complex ATPase subunit type 1 TsaE [Prolixibacter sp. NT017]GET27490.1 tRNA (adenosine(37)-N6)-threonylcarbamoyltransferase complex ATPase subunit type 1 TsaE [Prolixibacter sp. NT017]
MFKAEIHSLEDINHIAKRFIAAHPADRVFAFYGKMGAGKTTFIKALCEEMQVIDYVTSPTFALINEYQTSTDDQIFHFDFYRIKTLEEAFDFGYEDYFFSGKHCFIEWPEKIEALLPENAVKVYITELDDGLRMIESKN